MKHENQARIIIMALLVSGSILLTFYFHHVLGIGKVFTHLFYIPIILGALWWGRTGTGIAMFLSALLILAHLIYRPETPLLHDCLRAVMFVAVSLVVVVLKGRMRRAESILQRQALALEGQVRAMGCLYAINRLREKEDLSIDEILGETVRLLGEMGRQAPRFGVRLSYGTNAMTSEGFAENADRIASGIPVNGRTRGQIELHPFAAEAECADNRSEADDFLHAVAQRLGKIIEHENARAELDQYRGQLEDRVRERTEELVDVNRHLRREIAKRKTTEASLRESEHQYRLLFENAGEAIYIAQNGRIRFSNSVLAALTGYPMARILEASFINLIHPEDRAMVAGRHHRRLAGKAVPQSYAFRILSADKTVRCVELNTVVIQWQGRPATLNFLRDITARKRMEASIAQIRKMEAIGALAGGIAHQFNNALSGITGYIDLLKFTLPDNPAVTRYCDAMLNSAQSMTGLTQKLLAYARGGKYQSREISLCQLVRDVLPLMISSNEKQISIDTVLSPQTPRVHADAVQMQMVLQAVINNAAEAIEKIGRIRIMAFDARIDPKAAEAFAGLPPGNYAGLSVADNGRGMTEKIRSRIFEPFFTTHFPGRGLGMAAAYGIVKNHGGYIYVDSIPGRGTTVHILLPPSEKAHADGPGQAPEPP